jgi:hypothetical protein
MISCHDKHKYVCVRERRTGKHVPVSSSVRVHAPDREKYGGSYAYGA